MTEGKWNFPQLSLLSYVERQFDVAATQPLANYSILCVQHLLASTGSLIASLVRCGAEVSRVHIVGKAYSTNEQVFEELRELGIDVLNPTFAQDADEPYDAVLRRGITLSLERLLNGSSRQERQGILVIDDGGQAIAAVHALSQESHISAVEQTTRGIRLVSALSPRFCVVNVGRSKAKLELEAPLIASSMLRGLEQLRISGDELLEGVDDVLMIGYGAIGRSIALRLRGKCRRLRVFDERREARRDAREDGFTTVDELDDYLGRSLVAASTGTVSFPASMHRFLSSGSILVNMGSSDLEFAAWELRGCEQVRALFDMNGRRINQDEVVSPWNTHYLLGAREGNVLLTKGGFPVDFDGGPDPIPGAAIQLTRSLLLAGALQASTEARFGLVEVDEDLQNQIVGEYNRLQSQSSEKNPR